MLLVLQGPGVAFESLPIVPVLSALALAIVHLLVGQGADTKTWVGRSVLSAAGERPSRTCSSCFCQK